MMHSDNVWSGSANRSYASAYIAKVRSRIGVKASPIVITGKAVGVGARRLQLRERRMSGAGQSFDRADHGDRKALQNQTAPGYGAKIGRDAFC
jgi:hypothetical protein